LSTVGLSLINCKVVDPAEELHLRESPDEQKNEERKFFLDLVNLPLAPTLISVEPFEVSNDVFQS